MLLQGSKITGYVTDRLEGGWRIVQGTGTRGGTWFAVHRTEVAAFRTRQQAVEHAQISADTF